MLIVGNRGDGDGNPFEKSSVFVLSLYLSCIVSRVRDPIRRSGVGHYSLVSGWLRLLLVLPWAVLELLLQQRPLLAQRGIPLQRLCGTLPCLTQPTRLVASRMTLTLSTLLLLGIWVRTLLAFAFVSAWDGG